MAFDSYFTDHYRLPYFGRGDIYSARADYERFVTLDRHFESYVGIIGVGVIQGWTISTGTGLTVSIDWGDGFINGYYSESGWIVKEREDVLPTDLVITRAYYTDETSGQIYDKVFYRQSLTLPDNADSFLYAYRNSNYAITDPYLEPNNGAPTPETSNTLSPSRTAVSFGYASSQQSASSSGRVFIGLVVARRGTITEVDTSAVRSLANMEAAIKQYGDYVINNHRHGGDGTFDPQPIRLKTDRRSMILSASSDSKNEFTAQNNEKSTTEEEHSHSYYVDSSGDGITVNIYGTATYHFHDISTFTVGQVKGSVSEITAHVHEVNLPPGNDDGWSQSDPVQIYVNDVAYEGDNATVNASAKTVTFTGDVTVKFRKYGIDHSGWTFEAQEKSLYRFMLRASLQYYSDNPDKTNIILPAVSTPVSVLENQAISGEARLESKSDTFLFVADAASNVTVTLLQDGHVDEIEVEILTNSEVQGKLPEGNILYIPASKITSGTFEPERIPVLSHLGRFLEIAEPRPQRLKSTDGRIYDIASDDLSGNVQIVYSVVDDGYADYYLSTSNGLYRKPPSGAYYFVINGEPTVTDPGTILTSLEEATAAYQRKTGDSIIIDSSYDTQITAATSAISGFGDYYEFTGARNENVASGYDQIWLFYVDQYKLTEYGYQAERYAGEILPDEEIIRELEQPPVEEGEEELPPLYLVENDFHKHTAKELLIEQGLISGYDGSTLNKLYSVSSDQMVTSVNADKDWSILDEAGLNGYIYDFSRGHSGVMAIGQSNGLRISVLNTGRGFRSVSIPFYGAEVRGVEIGFGDILLAAMRGSVCVSSDMGTTWDTNELSTSTVESIFYDSTLDKTGVTDSHYHTVTLNARGDGPTSTAVGHTHTVSAGVVGTSAGHTHTMIRTYYAIDKVGVIYRSSNNGADWAAFATIPVKYAEWSQPFASFGSVYIPVFESMISTSGSSWTDVTVVDFNVYSASRTFDGTSIMLGAVNAAYLFDGTTLISVYAGSGSPVPALYFDGIQKHFGRYLNNEANTVDMGGDLLLGTPIDAISVFDKYYPEQDGWSDGVEYDLYLNNKLLLSTRKGIDRTGSIHVTVDNSSVIDFSVSSLLASSIAVGASYIAVTSSTDFSDAGTVKISTAKTGNQDFNPTYFFDYYAKSGNKLLLTSPSPYSVEKADSGTSVNLMSVLGGGDIVRITVYEGKLTKIGVNTHTDIEDAFSTKDIGLGKRLADVYLSNIIHLTAATKYVFPDIGDDYRNTFMSMFDYNDIPGDPNNIDRFIDREASDLASLSLYKVEDFGGIAASLPILTAGFGDFSGLCLAASNVGLFKMDCSSSLEANWFRLDVDGSDSCHSVMQYRSDVVYVATEKGLYVNTDTTLESWTQIDEDVIGGIPTLVVPRWSTLVDEETGIDYWWGDWNGVVHENSALVNTIIASGEGFLSYSDDRGVTWLDGQFKDTAGVQVHNIVPLSYLLLRNGTMLACAKTTDGSEYGVYLATGTGAVWNEIYSVAAINGTIKYASVTDNLNVTVHVEYTDGTLPADDVLIGRQMVVGDGSYRVISNTLNNITLFGEGVMDQDSTTFELRPWRLNTVHEDSEKRVTIGSSVGALWDRGGLFSDDRKRDGSIMSLGNKAAITSLNISGTISTSFIIPEASVITAELDKKVVRNEMVDMEVKFLAEIPDLKIKSNGVTKGDGTVDIIVEGNISEVVNGYRFTIRGAGIRLYVDFDGVIGKDDLKGGVLTSEAEGAEESVLRENIGIFTVVGNTDSYIDLAEEYAAPIGYDPYARFAVGSNILASNSDGTVPVTVEFDIQRGVNELRGNKLNVRGDGGLPDGGEIAISGNDEIAVLLDETYTARATSVDGTVSSGTYSVFNTLTEGVDFFLSGVPFMPRSSFSDQLASRHSGHYHDLTMIPGPIEGTVSQFGAITASTVELTLSGATLLTNSYLVSNPTFFANAEILAYDPENTEISHRLVVVSHTATSITVSKAPDTFDFAGADPKKVGPGYDIILSTIGYGRTSSTVLTGSYVVSRSQLTTDATVGDTVLAFDSAGGMKEGIKVVLGNDNGLHFTTTVASVTGTSVTVVDRIPYDFTVEDNSYSDAYYGLSPVTTSDLTANASQEDLSIVVADASTVAIADVVDMYDDRGLYERHTVAGVVGTTVTLDSVLQSTYLVANGARVVISRENSSESHTHTVRAGEFSVVTDTSRQLVGDDLYHGHYLTPLLEEVLDMKTISGTTYSVGSDSRIFSSWNNGESWEVTFDLASSAEFSPLPSSLTGIFRVSSGELTFAASAGYFVYVSNRYSRCLSG